MAPICSDTGLPVPCIGYSGFTRNAPKLMQQAGELWNGEAGLATVTNVALMGCGGHGWRCDWVGQIH